MPGSRARILQCDSMSESYKAREHALALRRCQHRQGKQKRFHLNLASAGRVAAAPGRDKHKTMGDVLEGFHCIDGEVRVLFRSLKQPINRFCADTGAEAILV